MAEIVWSDPALADLDAIADYMALENPRAAARLVRRVFRHVDQLAAHPRSGVSLPEFRGSRYRQIVESPCRIIYRVGKNRVFVLHAVRGEWLLRRRILAAHSRTSKK
ncbi:MAG: type II toxin-antitoxin system RelE/ParE family toxin [Rhodocyclaceae bacterium]|nr:type II toxin-antitoxin system RelE/ParE family toxin [Rhodocyclaceae bacterium]